MKKIFLMVCIAAMLVLTGCEALSNDSQPVITPDDITPGNTVDSIIEQSLSAGDFAYFWIGEDKELTTTLFEEKNLYSDTITAQVLQDEIANQQRYQPVISAQEAANIAGNVMLEELGYQPSSAKPTADPLPQYDENNLPPMGIFIIDGGTDRAYWNVTGYAGELVEAAEEPRISIEIDATNGAVIGARFDNYQDVENIKASPVHPAYTIMEEIMMGDDVYGNWDPNHPDFASMLEQKKQQYKEILEGSAMMQGVKVQSIELSPTITDLNGYGTLVFDIVLEDGRKYSLFETVLRSIYTEYDNKGALWNCSIYYTE